VSGRCNRNQFYRRDYKLVVSYHLDASLNQYAWDRNFIMIHTFRFLSVVVISTRRREDGQQRRQTFCTPRTPFEAAASAEPQRPPHAGALRSQDSCRRELTYTRVNM